MLAHRCTQRGRARATNRSRSDEVGSGERGQIGSRSACFRADKMPCFEHGHKEIFMSLVAPRRRSCLGSAAISSSLASHRTIQVTRIKSRGLIERSPRSAKDYHEHVDQGQSFAHRLCRQGSQPRRMGPQGTFDRRDRNARSDGDARRIRAPAAAARRAHRGLAAYDHSDRRPDRDACGARRRCPLGLVQHLFDAGPRRRRHRRGRHAGIRGQGRVADGILGIHPPHLRMGRRRRAEHDPR